MFWPLLTLMLLIKLLWDVTENRIIVRKVLKFFSNITRKYSDHLDFYQYFDSDDAASDSEESEPEEPEEPETESKDSDGDGGGDGGVKTLRRRVQTTKELQSKIKETLN